MKYQVTAVLKLKPIEADSREDAMQYAYEEYMNLVTDVDVSEIEEVR